MLIFLLNIFIISLVYLLIGSIIGIITYACDKSYKIKDINDYLNYISICSITWFPFILNVLFGFKIFSGLAFKNFKHKIL